MSAYDRLMEEIAMAQKAERDQLLVFGWWVQYISKDGECKDREGETAAFNAKDVEDHLRTKFSRIASLIENVAVWENEGAEVTENHNIVVKGMQISASSPIITNTPKLPHYTPPPKEVVPALDTYPAFLKLKLGPVTETKPEYLHRFYDVFPREKKSA